LGLARGSKFPVSSAPTRSHEQDFNPQQKGTPNTPKILHTVLCLLAPEQGMAPKPQQEIKGVTFLQKNQSDNI
jgi:hypothetical protein